MEYKDILGFPEALVKCAEEHDEREYQKFLDGRERMVVVGTKKDIYEKLPEVAKGTKKPEEEQAAKSTDEDAEVDKEQQPSTSREETEEEKERAREVERLKMDIMKNRDYQIDKRAKAIGEMVAAEFMKDMKKQPDSQDTVECSTESPEVSPRIVEETEEADDAYEETQRDRRRIVAEEDCEQKVGKPEPRTPEVPVLGTWDNRGKAQPVRLMLAYLEFKHIERRYQCGPPPDCDHSAWLDEQDTLGLDFPDLPYYIEGDDIRLTHAHVILRHFARRFGLEPLTEAEMRNADVAEQMSMDMMGGLRRVLRGEDFRIHVQAHLDGLELRYYSKWFGDRKWFAGDRITYVDFLAYEALAQHNRLEERCFHNCLNFLDFMKRFENIPSIHRYLRSDDALLWPLHGEWATFGSRHSPTISREYPEQRKYVREVLHNMNVHLQRLPIVEGYRFLRFNPLHPMYDGIFDPLHPMDDEKQ